MKNKFDKTDYNIRTKATNTTRIFMSPAMLKVVRNDIKDLELLSDEEFLVRAEFDRNVN